MANFRSLNSSKANMQSVKDHDTSSQISPGKKNKEKNQSEFNKFNINGDYPKSNNR
ncbi:MAG: hypothetical protein PHX70_11275 [Clostridium sp.]|nr:hypothetical protein [Clostridium sp.]